MDMDYRCSQQELERRKQLRAEMKRRREKQRKIALGAIGLVVVLILVLIIRGCTARNAEKEAKAAREAAAAAVKTQVVTPHVTIAAVGDIMCYDEQLAAAKQADGSYDFAPSLAAVKPYLETADLTVGNLEVNLADETSGYVGFPDFRAPASLATALKDAGFDLLQTANTYTLQNGLSGLNTTILHLAENGLDHVGTFRSKEDRTQNPVYIKNLGGIRFAFFAATKSLNGRSIPEGEEYCTDVLFQDYNSDFAVVNREGLLASVQAAKDAHADVIVAMLHWGSEFEAEPSDTQEEIAKLLFENGVDVILGSHSHEVGKIETRKVTVDGEEKTVLLAYSLGNFFSSMDKETSRTSLILRVEFSMDPETGEVTLSKTSYLPVYLADKGEASEAPRYEVLPIRSAKESSLFGELTETFDAAIATLKTRTGSTFDSGK